MESRGYTIYHDADVYLLLYRDEVIDAYDTLEEATVERDLANCATPTEEWLRRCNG